jgi:hypothetical protein
MSGLSYTHDFQERKYGKRGVKNGNRNSSISKEIKAAIKDIFNVKNQRRVAISAFVGDEANAYLPYPKGIELYCRPKAGGTNTAIRDLQKRGVKVYFSDSLHMKLYWSKKGVVITSANLSTYALGAGGLKEIGVLLATKSVNINKTIQSLDARGADEDEIAELEQAHKKILRTNPNLSSKSNEEYSFEKWYNLKSHKKGGDWRLASYSTANVKLSKKAGDKLEKEQKAEIMKTCLKHMPIHINKMIGYFAVNISTPHCIALRSNADERLELCS